jgi:mannan endo-1,4-beta-mannosidase
MRRILIFIILTYSPLILFGQGITSDQKATNKTKALYANLLALSGKGVLFGHQDDPAYGIGWKAEKGRSDVKDVCGSYPALYGWDISGLGRSFNIDSVDFGNMRQWIREAYRRGGVNTISWHMDNPVTGGNSWDNTPAVSSILPGGSKHEFYKQRLDLFAEFLNQLKVGIFGTKVPIIFRPFHEHTGSWFWWGKGNCTAQEYKALWQFTVDYLRNEKGIHQLLFSYSTDQFNSKEQYLEFYPGDDYVDIIAFDDYHSIRNADQREKLKYRLRTVTEIARSKNKVSALSETGLETIPIEDWFTDILLDGILSDEIGKGISYVMVWRNAWPHHFYGPYPGHAAVPDFIKFRNDPYTIFENDLPNMYRMPKSN